MSHHTGRFRGFASRRATWPVHDEDEVSRWRKEVQAEAQEHRERQSSPRSKRRAMDSAVDSALPPDDAPSAPPETRLSRDVTPVLPRRGSRAELALPTDRIHHIASVLSTTHAKQTKKVRMRQARSAGRPGRVATGQSPASSLQDAMLSPSIVSVWLEPKMGRPTNRVLEAMCDHLRDALDGEATMGMPARHSPSPNDAIARSSPLAFSSPTGGSTSPVPLGVDAGGSGASAACKPIPSSPLATDRRVSTSGMMTPQPKTSQDPPSPAPPPVVSELTSVEIDELLRALVALPEGREGAVFVRVAAIRALARFAEDEDDKRSHSSSSSGLSTIAGGSSSSVQVTPEQPHVAGSGAAASKAIWGVGSRLGAQPSSMHRIERLIASGAVDLWCRLCRSGGSEPSSLVLRQEAARALGNVAAFCEGAAEQLVTLGCVDALIALMSDDILDSPVGVGAVHAALDALANQYGSHDSLPSMANAKCLEALVSLSTCDSPEVAESSGWLLCLLSTEASTAHATVAYPPILPTIVSYGRRDSPSAQEEAAWALAALSAEPESADKLAASDSCYDLLLSLLHNGCEAVRLQAAWGLANLALHPIGKQRLAELPSVGPLVAALHASHTEDDLLHQALRCLGSILAAPLGRLQLLDLDETKAQGGAEGALRLLVGYSAHRNASIGDAAMRSIAHACAQPCSAAPLFLAVPAGLSRLRELLLGPQCKRQKTAASAMHQLAAAAAAAAAASTTSSRRSLSPADSPALVRIAAGLAGDEAIKRRRRLEVEGEQEAGGEAAVLRALSIAEEPSPSATTEVDASDPAAEKKKSPPNPHHPPVTPPSQRHDRVGRPPIV